MHACVATCGHHVASQERWIWMTAMMADDNDDDDDDIVFVLLVAVAVIF
jgi:hypothetical protein